jgi:hypothetical protein
MDSGFIAPFPQQIQFSFAQRFANRPPRVRVHLDTWPSPMRRHSREVSKQGFEHEAVLSELAGNMPEPGIDCRRKIQARDRDQAEVQCHGRETIFGQGVALF